MDKKLLILLIILAVLLVILITMGIFSFLNKNNTKIVKTETCSPEAIGAAKLSNLTGHNLYSQRIDVSTKAWGANAVIEKLKQDRENPDDFYATVKMVEKSGIVGYLVTFHLFHKNDFLPENCNKPSNPSGKSRDMVYDSNQQKIISDLLWQ